MSREPFEKRCGVAAAILLLVTGPTACAGQARYDLCVDHATREQGMLWKATMSAFPDRDDVLSVSDYSGCDSANSGAWLKMDLRPEAERDDIESALERAGWTKDVKHFIPFDSSSSPEMARRWGRRIIGLSLWKEDEAPEDVSRMPWSLEVQAIDRCWTDDHYTCPDEKG
ncbi:hypothetical protein GCM10017673_31960 [Streptosporangium violaceochromogenes]|nr:hypothetical protein GCM10017673_31960 [Streptosporangium violaceochromogenes]